MENSILFLPGDGIGPEVTNEAVKVLKAIEKTFNKKFNYDFGLLGGNAIEKTGVSLPPKTWKACQTHKVIFVGAVGDSKYDSNPVELRPEHGFKLIRTELELYCNIRPVRLVPGLEKISPLKNEIASKGIDITIVRELTGGIYFGEKNRTKIVDGEKATDLMSYSSYEVERIGRIAFQLAQKRRKILTSVDKAHVLESSRLWREIMHNIKHDYPDVQYNDLYVDNAAMQIIKSPNKFDVIVTENMFGDILSDEASILSGSLGLLPSVSFNPNTTSLYEPVHGSAPDIAGKDLANPIAAILSIAMMLRHTFDLEHESNIIQKAVENVLKKGYHTQDILGGGKVVGTKEMGDLICSEILAE